MGSVVIFTVFAVKAEGSYVAGLLATSKVDVPASAGSLRLNASKAFVADLPANSEWLMCCEFGRPATTRTTSTSKMSEGLCR
jgi:hypothetical protein